MFEILDILSAFLHESSLHIQSIKHISLMVTWIYQIPFFSVIFCFLFFTL